MGALGSNLNNTLWDEGVTHKKVAPALERSAKGIERREQIKARSK